MLIVGVGLVDRVAQQRYQPRPQDHLCYPLGGHGRDVRVPGEEAIEEGSSALLRSKDDKAE